MPIHADSRLLAGSRKALPAALLLPLVLTAACGGGGKSDDGAKTPPGVLSADRLTKALLTSSDVPHVAVVPAAAGTELLGGAQTVDKPECRPLADQWSYKPKRPRQLYSGATVTDTAAKDKKAKTITLEVISAYKKGEAKTVLDELTASVAACRGYRTTRDGATTAFTIAPVAATGAPLGDQQVTYTITDTARGASAAVLVTVVRTGDSTAAYETVRADRKPAVLRPAIPLKQAEKLRAAATGK